MLANMCERFYEKDGTSVRMNATVDLVVDANCQQCTGAPFSKTFKITFKDPCEFALLADSQDWITALPTKDSDTAWSLLNVDLRQATLIHDLTAGYHADNVTDSVNIELFCGAPSYKVSV